MKLLERHFEMALAAPDGIKKLRELILTLAMQGKLVPQDPADQPASELLKEIEAEKRRLVKEGKIKKQEPLPPIKPEELPYEVPAGWEWVRLGDMGETNIGLTYSPKEIEDIGIPVLRSNNIQNGKIDLNNLVRVNKKVNEKVHVQKGDILICARNGSKALVGKAAQIKELPEKMAFGAFMAIFRSRCNDFVEDFLNSPIFRKALDDVSTTTINQITQNNLKNSIVPLPPLAEQKRIVAKIDQLMVVCDRLEAERNEQNRKRVFLHRTAMDQLLSAVDAPSFDAAWSFIVSNFSVLYSVPENVVELKKAILQLAVMGKLVPQDPSDQPASELLKQIEAEKKKLIKEGKIKKQEPLPSIKPEELPYEVPAGWEWVRLNDLSLKIHYGYTASANHDMREVRLLRITDIQDNKVNWNEVPGCDIEGKSIEQYELAPNDILIARTGGTVGKSFLVDLIDVRAVFASYLIRVVPSNKINVKYLKLFLESPNYWQQLYSKCSGTGQPNVNGTGLSSLTLPLPPLAEQQRIVAKVDSLLALCDTLEQQLKDTTDKQTAILNAVVARM